MDILQTNQEKVLVTSPNKYVTDIVINFPEKLNALDQEVSQLIASRIIKWLPPKILEKEGLTETYAKEEVPRVIILRGAGNKVFCAGGDVISTYNYIKADQLEKIYDFYRIQLLLAFVFSKMEPIQVSIWSGYTMGGGVGISVNAPIRIATDNSVLAMSETAIGLFPDAGASYFMTRIFNNIPEIGLYAGLTGYRISKQDLTICGVATHFIKSENLETVRQLIIDNTNQHTDLEKLKELIKPCAEVIYNSEKFFFPNEDLIKQVFKFDGIEAIFGRLNKLAEEGLPAEKNWATKTISELNTKSPISLVVTAEYFKRGLSMRSIDEAYELDKVLFTK